MAERLSNARESGVPLLSVVIPTHNVDTWIEETLASVLAQDLASLEVIVIDDHSTDSTPDVVERIALTDGRVHLVRANERGGGSARNAGIALARGKYLAFCDGDDIVPHGAYRALVASAESSGSDIVFGDFLKFSPIDTWRPTATWASYAAPFRGRTIGDEPTLLYGRACWNKVFRRSFWIDSGVSFPDVARSNDIVPMTAAYLAAGSIDMVSDVVYLYRDRQGTGSMTSKSSQALGTLSYFEQERACAALVAAADSPELNRVYRSLIVERDGWVHLKKYLLSDGREHDGDEQVLAAFRDLLARSGADIESVRDEAKRLVLGAVLRGETDLASALTRALFNDNGNIDDEIAAWTVALTPELGGSELSGWHSTIPDRLRDSLIDATTSSTNAVDDELRAAAAALCADHPAALTLVPEFTDHLKPGAVASLANTRAVDGSIVRLRTGNAIEIALELAPDVNLHVDNFELHAYFGPDRHPVPFTRESSAHGVSTWRLPAGALPRNERFAVVGFRRDTGTVSSIRFRAPLDHYSRIDRFLIFATRGHVELMHRDSSAIRAIRALVRRAAGVLNR